MTPAERLARREEIASVMLTQGTDIRAAAVIYLADVLAPAVDAFVDACKIGGAFNRGPR